VEERLNCCRDKLSFYKLINNLEVEIANCYNKLDIHMILDLLGETPNGCLNNPTFYNFLVHEDCYL